MEPIITLFFCFEHLLSTASIFVCVKMVLFVIGLGLGDEKDITVRGLESIRKCTRVYLEYYTSVLGVDKAALVCIFKSL